MNCKYNMSLTNNLPTIIALIPARAGSKRVPGKNIRPLAGHPVMAYSIAVALESGIFAKVIVSTDSEEYATIARYYGAEVPFLRPDEIAGDLSPDIEWIDFTLRRLEQEGRTFDCFCIIRPTSPFRRLETIRKAWYLFLSQPGIDSLRAVEKCTQHPGKMWVIRGNRMLPLLPLTPPERPWHSCQYQSLPEVYVQNASLEIAWTKVVFEGGTIAGNSIVPFITQEYEGFDINNSKDWLLAQELISSGKVVLPRISISPWNFQRI